MDLDHLVTVPDRCDAAREERWRVSDNGEDGSPWAVVPLVLGVGPSALADAVRFAFCAIAGRSRGTAPVAVDDVAIAVGVTAMVRGVKFSIVLPEQLEWTTRPHDPNEPARHVAELQGPLSFAHTRANIWRYEPGAKGRRHVHAEQDEAFVVLAGRLTMYLGEPAERYIVPLGGIVHVRAGTPLQTVNEADEDLVVYAYGSPPDEGAKVLPPARQVVERQRSTVSDNR